MPDRIYLSPPHMGRREREMLLDAFDSNWIAPLGPHVDAFEQEFAEKVGTEHAIAVSSGTAALHLALVSLGVGPGDEVLTSSLTFVASANAIRYTGATPVFFDSDRDSWNIDTELLADYLDEAAKAGTLPKAILAVDICGQAANWSEIKALSQRYGVPTVEDAAESLGATHAGEPAGSWGDVGCFSFNGNKIITTSGGGMVATDDANLARRVRHLATQAREPVTHYQHEEVGYNYRLSNLLAALGRGQLSKLDHRVRRRRTNFEFYVEQLSDIDGVDFMPEPAIDQSTRWLTCLTLDPGKIAATPSEVCRGLAAEQIEARPMWKPMHLQPAYSGSRIVGGEVSEELFARGLCLPSGSNLTPQQLQRVATCVRTGLRSASLRRAA